MFPNLGRSYKSRVFDGLRARGVTQAIAHYSGGNDEGGVDYVELTFADGRTEHLRPHYAPWRGPDERTPQQRADQELYELLEAPVSERYGSFAGEFYVSGQVVYDVAADRITLDGQEDQPVAFREVL